jgi:hypothetical protein
MNFLQNRALPLHHLCQAQSTVLHDEDIAGEIRTQIIEKSKKGFVKAEDFINLIVSSKIQKIFSEKGICKVSISKKQQPTGCKSSIGDTKGSGTGCILMAMRGRCAQPIDVNLLSGERLMISASTNETMMGVNFHA